MEGVRFMPGKTKSNLLNELFPVLTFIILLAGAALVFQTLNNSFLSFDSVINMLKTVSTMAIAALGLMFVIIIGYSDISFYMNCCFSAMFMAWLIAQGWHPVFAIIAGLASGFAWGAVSGFAVGYFKLPDIISTIAVGSIAFGAAYVFSDGTFIFDNFLTSGITQLNELKIFQIPLPVYIMALLFIASYIVLDMSKLGRSFYAIGSNKKAAFFSGVSVNRIIVAAFIVCTMLASVSAMISTAAQGNGNVKIGLNLLMPSFSSIYIGWSIFRRPCVLGTFLGALLTTVMSTGFIVVSVPYYYADLVIAFVLIIAILLSKVDLSNIAKKFARRGKEVV